MEDCRMEDCWSKIVGWKIVRGRLLKEDFWMEDCLKEDCLMEDVGWKIVERIIMCKS